MWWNVRICELRERDVFYVYRSSTLTLRFLSPCLMTRLFGHLTFRLGNEIDKRILL